MFKKLTLAGLAALMATGVSAAPITVQQALERVSNGSMKSVSKTARSARLVATRNAADGEPALYLFDNATDGFMILSADDNAYPVLAYSTTGSLSDTEMAPGAKYMLDEYARQIEFVRSKGIKNEARVEASADWTAISPLLKTKWDQDAPYNNMCPTSSGKQTYTGCVATSMAQVMNYFKYPEVGEGIKQYTATYLGKRLTINFAQRAFDWNNMLDVYRAGQYDTAQADAVAYLMKACGYSVEMNYTPDASGAGSASIGQALRTYFKYDINTRMERRLYYTALEWMKLVYDNLAKVGPVILNGQSPLEGGHSFVCDGYDGQGLFHINWGWAGLSDGYFALEALNPDAIGIGGYTGGFNFSQDAIVGIQPPTGNTTMAVPDNLLQCGATVGTLSGNTLTFGVKDYNPLGWLNPFDRTINVRIGAIITPVDGTAGQTQYVAGLMGSSAAISLEVNRYYSAERIQASVTLPTLADGKYKVTLATQPTDGGDWNPVLVPLGYPNYVILTVQGGKKSIENVAIGRIVMSDVEILTPVYPERNIRIKAKFTNNAEIELTEGVCPELLLNGKQQLVGESIIVTLAPGESVEKEWVTRLYPMVSGISYPNTFDLSFLNMETNNTFGTFGTVTVEKAPAQGNIMLTSINIPGAVKTQMQWGDRTLPSVFVVEDKNHIPFSMTYKIQSGYYDGTIDVSIYQPESVGSSTLEPVMSSLYSEMPFLSAGQSGSINTDIDFIDGEASTLYYITVRSITGTSVKTLANTAFVIGSTGVDAIETEEGEPVYYNMQGVRVENPVDGEMYIRIKDGKAEKVML